LGWLGLGLLGLALVLMLTTGWPSYAVLLGLTGAGALFGLASGSVDLSLLALLPARVIGLLEQDLLQAIALYALVGALLARMAIADDLRGGLARVADRLRPGHGGPLALLLLGALVSPLNGSVGASVLMLARAAPASGTQPAEQAAAAALAGTLGVVVPPSLVLLLLGDTMLRAHTEGLNLARDLALPLASRPVRIVNTQDLLQAALLPGLLLLAGWLVIAAWRGGDAARPGRWTRRELATLLVVPAFIVALLVGVASGQVRAVEGAAAAAMLLLAWGAVSRQLDRRLLRAVLDDALALTGALFALLVAATSFSLLLRAFGTDRLVGAAMLSLQGHPWQAVGAVLAALLGSAFVLDAFELIFLVVPIVMPPLLAQVADAAWVATLALLVLQLGFLLPPAGYAVVLARANAPSARAGGAA